MALYNDIQSGKVLIAGPCVIESRDILFRIAEKASELAAKHGFTYVFKASFDKANRTSASSFRGPGMEEGLKALAEVKREFGVYVTTDIHESYQAAPVAEVADILQIPAFLCRQTDLLVEAGKTGKIVNIKKAQFLPPQNMVFPVEKVKSTGNEQVMLTERGSMYGFSNLVVDFTGVMDMMKLGVPVVMDCTHSVQKPSVAGATTGGNREYAPFMAYAAASVGVKGFFMEVHPEPEKALSDGPNTVYLDKFDHVLSTLNRFLAAAEPA